MNFMCILAAVGMLTIAGACGVLLGILEKKAIQQKQQEFEKASKP